MESCRAGSSRGVGRSKGPQWPGKEEEPQCSVRTVSIHDVIVAGHRARLLVTYMGVDQVSRYVGTV